jgi:SAM-dependent methyltransferase
MALRDWTLRFYFKAQSRIAPGLQYAQAVYEEVLWRVSEDGPTWLDLGCGHQLLPTWRNEHEVSLVGQARFVVGLDPDRQALRQHASIARRVEGSATKLPFAGGCFDLVTSNMVFEHLDRPEVQMREIARVLRPGGLLVFHTPNVRGYATVLARLIPEFVKKQLVWLLERRKSEDVYPTYYRANSEAAIRALCGEAGLEIEQIRLINSGAGSAYFPPLAVLELLLIRVLMLERFRSGRPNIIATVRKSVPPTPRSVPSLVDGR